MRNVIGIKLTADTRNFARGIAQASRSWTGLQSVISQTTPQAATNAVSNLLAANPLAHRDVIKSTREKAVAAARGLGLSFGTAMITGMGITFTSAAIFEKVLAPALTVSADFQKEMARLSVLSGKNVTDAQLAHMRELALEIGLRSQFTAGQVANAIGNLITTGLTPQVAQDAVGPMIDAIEASFGEIEPARAAKIFGIGLTKFKFPEELQSSAEKARYLADSLLMLKQSSRIEFKEILSFLDSMQAAPAILDVPIDQAFALGTSLMRLGTSGRRAAMQMSSIGNTLTKVQTAFDEDLVSGRFGKLIRGAGEFYSKTLGRDVDLSTFEGKSGLEVLSRIAKMTDEIEKKVGKAQARRAARTLFSESTGLTVMEAIRTLKFDVMDANGQIQESLEGVEALMALLNSFSPESVAGLSEGGAKKYRETWEGISNIISGIIDNIEIIAMSPLMGSITAGLDSVRRSLEVVADLSKAFPTAAASGMALIFAFTGITFAVGATTLALAGLALLISTLAPMFTAIASVVGISVWPLLLTGVGILAALAAGAAILTATMYAVWEAFKQTETFKIMQDRAQALKDTWAAFIQFIEKGFVSADLFHKIPATWRRPLADVLVIIDNMAKAWRTFKDTIDLSGVAKELDWVSYMFDKFFSDNTKESTAFLKDLNAWQAFAKLMAGFINIFLLGVQLTIGLLAVTAMLGVIVYDYLKAWFGIDAILLSVKFTLGTIIAAVAAMVGLAFIALMVFTFIATVISLAILLPLLGMMAIVYGIYTVVMWLLDGFKLIGDYISNVLADSFQGLGESLWMLKMLKDLGSELFWASSFEEQGSAIERVVGQYYNDDGEFVGRGPRARIPLMDEMPTIDSKTNYSNLASADRQSPTEPNKNVATSNKTVNVSLGNVNVKTALEDPNTINKIVSDIIKKIGDQLVEERAEGYGGSGDW